MAIVAYNTKELDLLARIMRAEATGEGNLGMLMVGNVGINRVILVAEKEMYVIDILI